MNTLRRIILSALFGLFILSISGCASMGVKAWDRDILAKENMLPDKNLIEREIDDHIYFSKEGSSGGRGFGGGGCGCN